VNIYSLFLILLVFLISYLLRRLLGGSNSFSTAKFMIPPSSLTSYLGEIIWIYSLVHSAAVAMLSRLLRDSLSWAWEMVMIAGCS